MTWIDSIPALAHLSRYWSLDFVGANLLIGMHLLGALLLGMLVGYERRFRGRAAGMRTYGLVCMTSAALTVVTGVPEHWFGGHTPFHGETSHVIQGIVTGIGFLGAGVIMRDGFHVTGLSTAASIWTSSAIGMLVGAGFYPAGMLLALVSALSMEWGRRLERKLPTHAAMAITLQMAPGQHPSGAQVSTWLRDAGFQLFDDSLLIRQDGAGASSHTEWRFTAGALDLMSPPTAADLAERLRALPGVAGFSVTPYKS